MEKTGTTRKPYLTFDGVYDLIEWLDGNTRGKGPGFHHSHDSYDPSFCKETYDEARAMLSSGWTKGTEAMERMSNAIADIATDTTDIFSHDVNFDVTGDFIDMGRVMAGEPETFGHFELTPKPQESIDVVINVSYSCAVDQSTVYNRGAAITALVEQLRKRYHVNLRFIHVATSIQEVLDRFTLEVKVNTENEFSRDMLAFLTANASYLRKIIFKATEIICDRESCGGYGRAEDYRDNKENVVYFPCMVRNEDHFSTIEKAANYVKGILENLQNQKRGE
jgi:hypothetical protein